jgi:hypothetical protein
MCYRSDHVGEGERERERGRGGRESTRHKLLSLSVDFFVFVKVPAGTFTKNTCVGT